MKNTNNILHRCRYHIIFCTKYKRKVLNNNIRIRLYQIIKTECALLKVDILRCTIKPEVIQLHLDIDPQLGVHKVVKHLKRTSSRLLRSEYHELTTKLPSLWTNSYMVSTLELSEADIEEYLKSQKTSQRE